jgi:protease-4
LGFAASFRYLRLVFDRLGVVPEVYARGRYKSAGESVARDAMSEAQKEQTNALLDRNYAAFVDGMSEGRGLAKDVVAQLVDGAPYSALEAKAHRLVDDVAYEDEVPERLGPEGVEVPLRAVGNYLARRTATQRRPVREPDVIGVIGIEGTIAQDASTWPRAGTVTDTAAIAALRRARRQRHVKGVVVYIDSPGGSALASDRIHREVQLLAREKPVAVCMGNVAASGGYYVAAAAPYIVANPLTVTGSIGVISARFAVAPLLERFGIRLETLQRGERASLLDSLQPYSERERKVVEREIEHIYGGFLSVVAEGRGRRVEEVAPLAEGRVWSGADAFDRGLVDKLGGFDDALAYVRERLPEGLGPLEPVWVMGTTKEEPLAAKAKRSANIPDVLGAGLGIFAGCTEEFAATLSLLLRERVLMLSCDVHDPFDD